MSGLIQDRAEPVSQDQILKRKVKRCNYYRIPLESSV